MPTFPLTPPTSSGFAQATFRAASVVEANPSNFSLVTQIYVHRGQRWEVDLQLPPLKGADAAQWRAFMTSLNGREGTFLLGDPGYRGPRGVATGLPLVVGGSQSGHTLNVDGFTPNITGILLAGDYFGLSSGSSARLYQVVADVNSDGSGAASIPIWPRLRTSPTDNAPLVLDAPKTVFRLTSNLREWQMSPGGGSPLYGLAFGAEEAL